LDVRGGILVQDVKRGGLASLSNIVAGDVIIQVNGTPILNSQMFAKTMAAYQKIVLLECYYSSRSACNFRFTFP
jgi:serine protease Do